MTTNNGKHGKVKIIPLSFKRHLALQVPFLQKIRCIGIIGVIGMNGMIEVNGVIGVNGVNRVVIGVNRVIWGEWGVGGDWGE